MRHLHRALFWKSNIYFVCRLRPLTETITSDPFEIAECLWMPIDTFLQHERAQAFHKALVTVALQQDGMQIGRLPNYDYQPERAEFFLPINYTA